MPTHYWGEKDFDWAGLDDALKIIVRYLRRGRISIWQYKEKYGTIRIYCTLGWYCLHNITHPGHAFYRYPKWLIKLDTKVLSKIIPVLFNRWVLPLHKWLYRYAYKKAILKHPHLYEEIVCCADYDDLLKGLEVLAKTGRSAQNDMENRNHP